MQKFIEMQDCNSSKSLKQCKIAFCDLVHLLQLPPSRKKRRGRRTCLYLFVSVHSLHKKVIFCAKIQIVGFYNAFYFWGENSYFYNGFKIQYVFTLKNYPKKCILG